MSGNFTIDIDPLRDLVRITLSGFFTPPDIARFLDARAVAHANLRCAPRQHVTLTDVTAMKIQAQDIVQQFHAILAAQDYQSRRLAFIVGPTLARTQLARATGDRDVAFFTDAAEAEAWLVAT